MVEAESDLGCHLDQVLASDPEGPNLEEPQLGARTERRAPKSSPFFLQKIQDRGERTVVECFLFTPTLPSDAGNSCQTSESSQKASPQSSGMFIVVLNNVCE